MKKIILLLLLFSSPVFAADSTSYAPPGVAQNQHQAMHGYSITGVGELEAASITLGGVTKDTWPGGTEGSLGTNGWTKLDNGLIIQWGLVTTNAVRYKPFPIPFPNACVSVQVTANRNWTSASSSQAYTVDRFGAHMVADITHGPAWWMALGY